MSFSIDVQYVKGSKNMAATGVAEIQFISILYIRGFHIQYSGNHSQKKSFVVRKKISIRDSEKFYHFY